MGCRGEARQPDRRVTPLLAGCWSNLVMPTAPWRRGLEGHATRPCNVLLLPNPRPWSRRAKVGGASIFTIVFLHRNAFFLVFVRAQNDLNIYCCRNLTNLEAHMHIYSLFIYFSIRHMFNVVNTHLIPYFVCVFFKGIFKRNIRKWIIQNINKTIKAEN